jgi:hypothetical protein
MSDWKVEGQGMDARQGRGARALLLLGTGLLLGLLIVSYGPGNTISTMHSGKSRGIASGVRVASSPADSSFGALQLGVTDSPSTICAFDLSSCSAGVGESRVTVSANAGGSGFLAWPAVQVAFVVETTDYDGVYDPNAGDPGTDPCAGSGGTICEESNGVPFFVAHAQDIANSIAAANPHSKVSFAMVDYFASLDQFDDGDGDEYHVDIQQFVPSQDFGSTVVSTFQAQVLGGGWIYGDSDMSDNQLHSSVITAMYGTIIGSGLTWSNATHHVIVWMGSSAPEDPNYVQNYCVSASDSAGQPGCGQSATCEPAHQFVDGASPKCEGWIRTQDGNANDSIAQLAKTSPTCTDSIGGVCTVDTIDLWTTPTDPLSKGWPTGRANGGPGGSAVVTNVQHVLLAGCDMAAATGGTWDGPAFFTCPNGQQGTLQYVQHGPATKPNLNNPTLLIAFRQIGFGPILETQVASGSNRPIFTFVPFGHIAFAPDLQPAQQCQRHGVDLKGCGKAKAYAVNGVHYLGWNWSTNKSQNTMFIGDSWTASFNIMATGGPFTTVPLHACITPACKAAGSTSINGFYSSASFVPFTNSSIITESFPLALITVQLTPGLGPVGAPPPPPPPAPPGIPIVAPTAVGVPQQIGIGNQVGVANISLQAASAGFLGAGFVRVQLKNKPIAMRVAAKAGPMSSKFDSAGAKSGSGVGHFE